MSIRNINEFFGEEIEFDSLEEYSQAIRELGYTPEDGLVEGRDYVVIDEREDRASRGPQ